MWRRHICGQIPPILKNNKILKGKIKWLSPPKKTWMLLYPFKLLGQSKHSGWFICQAKSSILHRILPQSAVFIPPSRWYPKSKVRKYITKYREIIQEYSERLEDAAFQGMKTDKNKKNLEEFVRKLMMEILFSFVLFCVSYFLCGHHWFFQSTVTYGCEQYKQYPWRCTPRGHACAC